MDKEVGKKTTVDIEKEENKTNASISRRTALKYIGAGIVGGAGALYGFNKIPLGEHLPEEPSRSNEVIRTNEKPIVGNVSTNNESMKIVLINGSPRKNGNTFTALTEVANTLEAEGVKTSLIQIGTKPIQGCIACNACKRTGECVFKDELYMEVRKQLAESDGVIIGSPVYYAGPNGSLCALLDRVFYTSGDFVKYKLGAAVAICRRGGATSALDRLNKYFTISNMVQIGSQYWNIAYGREPGEVSQDAEGMQIMRTLARNTAWTLKNIKAGQQPLPTSEPRISTDFVKKDI